MRILLGHNSTYYPGQGGGDKSNRLLMEALAERGHSVRVVTRVEHFGDPDHASYVAHLRADEIPFEAQGGAVRARLRSVDVHTLTLDPHIGAFFAKQIAEFDPEVILCSTDDPGHLLLEPALAAPRARVVYLVRATIALPFGPDSSGQSAAKMERLRQADAVVGVSEAVARYVREWGGMPAVHVPISLLEPGTPPLLGRFENPYVLMVNPCAVKGISIFLELAARLPETAFAAVPTWGTNESDLARLRHHSNIAIVPASENVDEVLRLARVVLVPSVWAEARSRIVLEAMARGIPVMASDAGGLPEAKMGVPYLIPVNVVNRYQPVVDSRMVPVPEVPAQHVEPWLPGLRRLFTERSHWQDIADQSRAAALRYLEGLTAGPFEQVLERTLAAPRRARNEANAAGLSEGKRKLLALRMRQAQGKKAAASEWFPRCPDERYRVFCFPHAGAGTFLYRDLGCAAVLPGREGRFRETPFDRMDALIAALEPAIAPLLDRPFVFFGHSMGSGVAFELTRALRRSGRPLPKGLIVSATRAPHLREQCDERPDLPDAEMLAEMRRLGGLQGDEDPELMQLLLPMLRADTRLYRNYVYREEAKLEMPIYAYCGVGDALLTVAQVAGWRDETSGDFRLREFPGGHFYLQDPGSGFREAFSADVRELVGR